MPFTAVCAAGELSPGEMRRFSVNGQAVALYRLDDGYHATAAYCTHERALLTGGRLAGFAVACPLHGARFDVRSGRVLSPPAFKPLKVFAVSVEHDMVQVDVGPAG